MKSFKLTSQEIFQNQSSDHRSCFMHDYMILYSKYEYDKFTIGLNNLNDSYIANVTMVFTNIESIEHDFTEPWGCGGLYVSENYILNQSYNKFTYVISTNNGNTIVIKANEIEYHEETN